MERINLDVRDNLTNNDKIQAYEDVLTILGGFRVRVESGEKIYMEVLDGPYTGTIGYIKQVVHSYSSSSISTNFSGGSLRRYRISEKYKLHVVGKQIPQQQLQPEWNNGHSSRLAYLKDYEGKTVYVREDRKAKINEYRDNLSIKDILGNECNEGDPVLFINMRYGDGAQLDTGVISEIAVIESKGSIRHEVVIRNTKTDRNGNEIISKLKYPEKTLFNAKDTDVSDLITLRLIGGA